jgi:outer membrane protein OmpA-like peptidoglycan-associated protein
MWLFAGLALAQDPALDLQRVVPMGPSHGFLRTPTARQLPTQGFSLGVLGHGAWGPFVQATEVDDAIVESAEVRRILAGHVHGAFGVSEVVELSLTAPVIQSVQRIASVPAFGDVRLAMGIRPLSEDVLGIALETFVSFPTGGEAVTRRVVMPGARLALSRGLGPFHVAVHGGARILPISGYLPVDVGVTHEALMGGGVAWEGVDGVRLNVEATGAVLGPNARLVRAEGYRSALITPVEGTASLRVAPVERVDLVAGGATAFVQGVATPRWRAFAGITLIGRVQPTTEPVEPVVDVPPVVPVPAPVDVVEPAPTAPVPHRGRPDRDRDGRFDDEDRCPLEPEDLDGFLDHDGCPDPDNDGDGVPDTEDLCPLDAQETPGPAADGCPDEVQVVLVDDRIHIRERVVFAPGSAALQEESTSILTAVLTTLLEHPELRRVRIEGHTDDTGDLEANMQLSTDRAAAVRTWLVEHGVEADRLTSEGFGPWSPTVPNDSPAARERNRRVEFHVLERVERPVEDRSAEEAPVQEPLEGQTP